jgi:hypothetical protein
MTMHAETLHEEVMGPRYDMSPEELQRDAELFLEMNPPRQGSGRFACYRIEGTSEFADIGRSIEGTVFMDTFNNSAETMRDAYGPYEEASIFFVNFDTEAKKPVGVLRVIQNSEAGLMTLNDLASGKNMHDTKTGLPVQRSVESVMSFHSQGHSGRKEGFDDLNDCWDVGTLAVLPEYRASTAGMAAASAQLYSSLYVSAMHANIKHFTSVIDAKLYRILTRFLGVPFEPLANTPEVNYMESAKSRVAYAYVPDFYRIVDDHRKGPFGRAARKPLDRMLDGNGGLDEQLQFFSVEQLKAIRRQARAEATYGSAHNHRRSIGRRILRAWSNL